MKRAVAVWTKLIVLLVLLAAGWFVYQSREKQKGPVPTAPARIEPPKHKESKLKGSVIEYGSNPDGDIDKMLLGTIQGSVWLHFPPHAARSVKAAAPVKSFIEVTIDQGGPAVDHHPDPISALRFLNNPGGKTSVDLTNIPAPAPRKGFEVEIKGNFSQDLEIGQDRVNNFVLSGTMISIPPHMALELFPLINRAKVVLVKGHMRDSTEGFLSASGLPVVKANLIQLDNVTYKIR